jgi:2-keto-4-pentenoate hydratase/2-oxohepta-3-ene-1,7-dioic acid hydratase in catechol pathway
MFADWSIVPRARHPAMGPCIVVGEADLANIDMETLVNGEVRQRFNARNVDLTFGEYLEYLSCDFGM